MHARLRSDLLEARATGCYGTRRDCVGRSRRRPTGGAGARHAQPIGHSREGRGRTQWIAWRAAGRRRATAPSPSGMSSKTSPYAFKPRCLPSSCRPGAWSRRRWSGHDIGGAAVLRAHLLESTPAKRVVLVDAVVLRPRSSRGCPPQTASSPRRQGTSRRRTSRPRWPRRSTTSCVECSPYFVVVGADAQHVFPGQRAARQ